MSGTGGHWTHTEPFPARFTEITGSECPKSCSDTLRDTNCVWTESCRVREGVASTPESRGDSGCSIPEAQGGCSFAVLPFLS